MLHINKRKKRKMRKYIEPCQCLYLHLNTSGPSNFSVQPLTYMYHLYISSIRWNHLPALSSSLSFCHAMACKDDNQMCRHIFWAIPKYGLGLGLDHQIIVLRAKFQLFYFDFAHVSKCAYTWMTKDDNGNNNNDKHDKNDQRIWRRKKR